MCKRGEDEPCWALRQCHPRPHPRSPSRALHTNWVGTCHRRRRVRNTPADDPRKPYFLRSAKTKGWRPSQDSSQPLVACFTLVASSLTCHKVDAPREQGGGHHQHTTTATHRRGLRPQVHREVVQETELPQTLPQVHLLPLFTLAEQELDQGVINLAAAGTCQKKGGVRRAHTVTVE